MIQKDLSHPNDLMSINIKGEKIFLSPKSLLPLDQYIFVVTSK